ncbi:MAG: hypothetical protein ACI4NE_04180 [Succinivibrio sp.]
MSTVNTDISRLTALNDSIKNSPDSMSPGELKQNINLFNQAMQNTDSSASNRSAIDTKKNDGIESFDSSSNDNDASMQADSTWKDKGMKDITQSKNSELNTMRTDTKNSELNTMHTDTKNCNLNAMNTDAKNCELNTLHTGLDKKELTGAMKHANKDDVDLLKSQMQQKESTPKDRSNMSELGSIFSSLMSGSTPSAAPVQSEAPLTSTDTGMILDKALSDGLVEKILVSDPKFSNTTEVRITLAQNSVLSGTEIILRRGADGMLAVEINARNSDQLQRLVGVRNEIIDSLEKHEKDSVRLVLSNQEEQQSQNQEK